MLERLPGIKDKVINWISCGSFGLWLICLCIGLDKLFRYKNGLVFAYLKQAYCERTTKSEPIETET